MTAVIKQIINIKFQFPVCSKIVAEIILAQIDRGRNVHVVVSYRVRLHINGNHTIGTYRDETRAAIAYNKSVDLAHQAGIDKKYPENYIEDLSAKDYAEIYTKVKISKKYLEYLDSLKSGSN